jgi:putative transcriptional regulator
MIRFRLAELMMDKGFREGRRVEIGEVADATGIHRSTLSRIINVRGTNVTTANLDSLCRYFACPLGELAEYVPDEVVEASATGRSQRRSENPAKKTSTSDALHARSKSRK